MKVGGEVSKGGRNDTLFKLASSLIAKELPADAIRASVHATNTATCNPPLPASEVDALLDSALSRYEPGLSDEAKEATENGGKKGKTPVHIVAANQIISDGFYRIDGAFAIWHPEKNRWIVGDRNVKKRIIEVVKNTTINNRRETIDYLDLAAPEGKWADDNFVAFQNGVLDLNTLELSPMDRTKIFPNVIPHNWNPHACAPVVDETLERIACGDPDIAFALAEVIGMSMYRGHDISQIPLLFGDGANGKSTLINFIWKLVGSENCTTIDMADLTRQFAMNKLCGKLCCVSDDIAADYINTTMASNLKKIATGDYVSAEEKYGRHYELRPYCGIIITTNRVPRMCDASSESMIRRLHPIPLDAKFTKDDPNFNPNLERELSTEEAIERGIVIGITALCSARYNKGLHKFERSSRALREIVLDSDPLGQWLLECDGDIELIGVPITDLYESYREWCKASGCQVMSKSKFGGDLCKREGLESTPVWIAAKGKTVRVYKCAEKRGHQSTAVCA